MTNTIRTERIVRLAYLWIAITFVSAHVGRFVEDLGVVALGEPLSAFGPYLFTSLAGTIVLAVHRRPHPIAWYALLTSQAVVLALRWREAALTPIVVSVQAIGTGALTWAAVWMMLDWVVPDPLTNGPQRG